MATFDSLAPTYDDDFTRSKIGSHLRKRVHQRLLNLWQPDQHILELGCGTGEDALFLGTHGIHVTATDASPSMQKIASEKTATLPHVNVRQLDLSHLPQDEFANEYDGVLSNFGALNCISDWQLLTRWLASRVKTGGTLAFAIMSPVCIWETLWHGLHLDFNTATRRWSKSARFQPDTDTSLAITYPSIRRITQDFAPHFQRTRIQPLGLFLPTSDAYPVIEKRDKLCQLLTRADDTLATVPQLALFADHYWIEFERV